MRLLVLICFFCLLGYSDSPGENRPGDIQRVLQPPPADEGTNSTFSYDDERKLLTVDFLEEDILKTEPLLLLDMRVTAHYRFDAPFSFPEELWKALGSSAPLTIQKGTYPVIVKGNSYSVHISF